MALVLRMAPGGARTTAVVTRSRAGNAERASWKGVVPAEELGSVDGKLGNGGPESEQSVHEELAGD